MKRINGIQLLLTLFLLGGLVVGCGGGSSNDADTSESPAAETETIVETETTETPETAETPEATTESATEFEAVEFTLVNDTDRPLLEFYVSAPSEEVWGEDLLPPDAFLGPRKQIQVQIDDGRPDCAYDLKAVFGPSPDGSVGGGAVFQTAVEICDGATYTYSQN